MSLRACALFVALATLAAGCNLAGETTRPAAATTRAAARPDPYPECAAIHRWLQENAREPGKVEIIVWEGRQQLPASPTHPETIVVTVKFRTINVYGTPAVCERQFWFPKGQKMYVGGQDMP